MEFSFNVKPNNYLTFFLISLFLFIYETCKVGIGLYFQICYFISRSLLTGAVRFYILMGFFQSVYPFIIYPHTVKFYHALQLKEIPSV